eukprot:TRINITY_DN4494_c0_g1_i1.p1 TRINITY_DN4494_c0_g1~~TRINITY_DN4494_c0_g1_i1.p1  ORF type:complete len:337 (-),score=76.49 TRINITY_DN4494_c0_g1_i1:28-921(-)
MSTSDGSTISGQPSRKFVVNGIKGAKKVILSPSYRLVANEDASAFIGDDGNIYAFGRVSLPDLMNNSGYGTSFPQNISEITQVKTPTGEYGTIDAFSEFEVIAISEKRMLVTLAGISFEQGKEHKVEGYFSWDYYDYGDSPANGWREILNGLGKSAWGGLCKRDSVLLSFELNNQTTGVFMGKALSDLTGMGWYSGSVNFNNLFGKGASSGAEYNTNCIGVLSSGLVYADNTTDLVWAKGNNQYGQLGLGHRRNQSDWKKVKNLDGEKIMDIACGSHHCLALTGKHHLQPTLFFPSL